MISWNELQFRQDDWLRVHSDTIYWRRSLLNEVTSRDRELFVYALERVRAGQRALIQNYAPGLGDRLERDSSVATTPHMDRLLQLALKHQPRVKPDPQRWFDAISLFDQALALTQIEKADPVELVGRGIEALIDLLSDRLFVGGFEPTDFFVYHDPEHEYLVGPNDVGIGKHLSHRAIGKIRRKTRLMCRRVRDNGLVFLHHRIKDPFGVWLKMQRRVHNGLDDPFVVPDRCGLMFVVEGRDDVSQLAKRITDLLIEKNAVMTEPLAANFSTSGSVDPDNGHSSSQYKVAKMRLRWRGREYELQFIAFHDYFNAARSLTGANHALYKLRQALDIHFPHLWPVEIYEIDWGNPHVRHLVSSRKIAQLGWRVEGEHNTSS
ncbi:hypothetical protein HZA85_00280 [Candidatus Uhrbacteria bacterium]|nr:hypothetical protein [Candidatus Uhrbacteria bacterium]